MTNGVPSNSAFPVGLTEADLIDLVDGALPPEREGVVIAALKASPRLGLFVKQLRSDRAELVELGASPVAAPAGMIEAIEAKLDREALGQLVAESEQISAPIPISTVVPTRPNIFTLLAESVWGRRLATAASLAIVTGIGFVAVREVVKSWPVAPGGGTPLAHNNNPRPSPTDHTSPSSGETAPNPTEVATNDRSPITDPSIPPPETVAAANGTDANPANAANANDLTLTEALQLAEAGRLVITVRSDNLEGSLRHLQDLSRNSDRSVRWRAYDDMSRLPMELASLSSPLPDEAAPSETPARPAQPANPPTFASQNPGSPQPASIHRNSDPIPPLAAPHHTVVRALRVVQTDSSTRALDGLLRDIAVNKSHQAKFRVLPENAGIDARPAVDAESILWWTRGASNWNKRISVPVIVETVE